jgi:hypothetical protein
MNSLISKELFLYGFWCCSSNFGIKNYILCYERRLPPLKNVVVVVYFGRSPQGFLV